MSYTFSNDKPIFLQIEEILKKQIVSGEILPGEKLKSVRELSAEFKVNPNTVQNALKNLENDRLIFTDRTNGKFVSSDDNTISKSKLEQIKTLTKTFTTKMKELGLDEKEIIKFIKENFDDWYIGTEKCKQKIWWQKNFKRHQF